MEMEMHTDFPNSYYATHEGFAIGVLACKHLETRKCVVLPLLAGDEPPSVCAVTLFPWTGIGIPGYLRIVPPRNRIRRPEHKLMQEHADKLTWIGPTATLVAINMNKAAGDMLEESHLERFFSALDQLCGYRPQTPEHKRAERHAKQSARIRDQYHSTCGWPLE